MTVTEIWLWVPGYEGYYKISNLGRVKSVKRPGKGKYTKHTKILKTQSRNGYPQIVLRKNGKRKSHRIHKLVLEAFVGPCPPGKQARHLNDNKIDCRLINLKYGTPKQNMKDAVRNGKMKIVRLSAAKGSRCHTSKLNWIQVKRIRFLKSKGWTQTELARKFSVSGSSIAAIVSRTSWKHI